jgi:hypothetical protein
VFSPIINIHQIPSGFDPRLLTFEFLFDIVLRQAQDCAGVFPLKSAGWVKLTSCASQKWKPEFHDVP